MVLAAGVASAPLARVGASKEGEGAGGEGAGGEGPYWYPKTPRHHKTTGCPGGHPRTASTGARRC